MIALLIIIMFTITMLSLVRCVEYHTKYEDISELYCSFKKDVDSRYIKVDARVRNAVYEARDCAIEKGRTYEVKIFNGLIEEIEERW